MYYHIKVKLHDPDPDGLKEYETWYSTIPRIGEGIVREVDTPSGTVKKEHVVIGVWHVENPDAGQICAIIKVK